MEIKVPFYNIVNIILPGLVLIGSGLLLFLNEAKDIATQISKLGSAGLEVLVTVSLFAIAYEVGYIIFRLGAVSVEPILKKMFSWADYNDFLKAGKTSEKAHDKLEMLSREYGFARTQIMLFAILILLTIAKSIINKSPIILILTAICVGCGVLFTVTAGRQMKRTQKAVTQYLASGTAESEGGING
jgi:hypothetical protein